MDIFDHIKFARWLTNLLDSKWHIGPIAVGLDPFFDLIPGAQILPTGLSLYLIWIAHKLHIPKVTIVVMVFRIFFDFVLSSIPWLGFFVDMLYRSNRKNIEVIEMFINPKE